MLRQLVAFTLLLLLLLSPAASAQRPGELDRSFANGGLFVKDLGTSYNGRYDDAAEVLIQPDGKILLVGDAEHGTNRDSHDSDPAVVRLNPDGTLDGTWGVGGVARPVLAEWDWIYAAALAPDGRLVAAGQNRPGGSIVRFTGDGSLDPSFGEGGFVDLPDWWGVASVDVMDDGRVVVAGSDGTGIDTRAVVMRFTPTGRPDPTFGGGDGRIDFRYLDGSERQDIVRDLVVEPSGEIVVTGDANWFRREAQIGVARVAADGSRVLVRKTIFLGGDFEDDRPMDLLRLADGRFVVAVDTHGGAAAGDDFGIARLTPNLSLDTSFGTGGYTLVNIGGDGDAVTSVAAAPDGKLVLAGSTDTRPGSESDVDVALMRFTPEGRLDPTFAGTGYATFSVGERRALDHAESVAIDPRDGGIVFGGYTSTKSGDGDFALGRVLGAYPALVSITGGPSGTTNRRDVRFEFAALTEQEGAYECRLLERVTWEPCVSPKTYGGLADGGHQFEVRFIPRGAETEHHRAAVRRFTTDTTPPAVTLDSATPNGADATFTFHASEDEATFRCEVAGRPAVDCSSPYRAFDLPEGAHRFSVWAADPAGNESEPAVHTWIVGGPVATPVPPPARVACPPGAHASVTIGIVTAIAQATAGCLVERQVGKAVEFSSPGPVKLNGIAVRPAPGQRLVLRRQPGDASVRLTGSTRLILGEIEFLVPTAITWPLGTANTFAKFALTKLEQEGRVAGLSVSGAPAMELTGDNGGSTKLGVTIELPSAFRAVPHATKDPFNPNADGGLTIEGGVTASNANGVAFNIKGKLQKAWLFGLELEDVGFGYDGGPPATFEGFGTVKLPGGGDLAIAVTLGPGGFAGGYVRKVSIQASKFKKPLGWNFFLQRFGGEFEQGTDLAGRPALTIAANAGVSFGPRIEIENVFDGEVVSLDGKVKVTVATPWVVEVTGDGKIVEVPVGNVGVKYIHGRRVELTGRLDFSIGGYGVTGEIKDAWFAERKFNVDAVTDLKLPGGVLEGRAETVLSSAGMAACYGAPDARIGFTRKWDEPATVLIGACDVAPYRTEAPKANAAAAAPDTFTVGKRTKLHVVAVTGADAPPKVTLVGPAGERVTTPADGTLAQTREAIVVQDPARATTTVALLAPRAGRWRIQTPDTVRTVRTAPGRAPVHVRASVKRGELRWTLTPAAGQRVTFIERGADGARDLITTNRRSGRLRLRPGTGRRTIEAVVTQGGLPRAARIVARFAGRSATLQRVSKLTLRRGVLRWRSQAAAARYAVAVEAKDGTLKSHTTARATLRVGCSARRVIIVGLRADGRPGPSLTRRVRC